MYGHAPFTTGPKPWRTIGRVALALCGGGVFAALAWEQNTSPGNAGQTQARNAFQETAARQGIVKEDGASPHFDTYRVGPQRELQWAWRGEDQKGLTSQQPRTQPWTAGRCGADATAGQHVGGQVPTSETTAAKVAATTGVSSRGPP
jgi:hypothetical protein